MDKNYHMKESANFCEEGSCYIHTEMKNGKKPMTVLCGDFLAMLWGVNAELYRIGELTNTDYAHAWSLARIIEEQGYQNVRNELYKDGSKAKFVPGHDVEEEWKAEKEEELKRQANVANVMLMAEMEELRKRNTSLNNQMVDIKKNCEKTIKYKDNQIKELTKELNALEHRFDELSKRMMFGSVERTAGNEKEN
jgi:hypothetical protein